MNSILDHTYILKSQNRLTDKHRKALSIIEQFGGHLLELIKEVLDLANIEAGNLELLLGNGNLSHLLQSVTDIMQTRARAEGLRFITVTADERRLR